MKLTKKQMLIRKAPTPNLPRVMLRAPLSVVAWMLLLLVGLATPDMAVLSRRIVSRNMVLLANRPTMSCYASTNRRSGQPTYRAVCSKRATLLGNVHLANRKAEVRAELTKRLDVKRPGIRGRGE
jgi:hypothetical protein